MIQRKLHLHASSCHDRMSGSIDIQETMETSNTGTSLQELCSQCGRVDRIELNLVDFELAGHKFA